MNRTDHTLPSPFLYSIIIVKLINCDLNDEPKNKIQKEAGKGPYIKRSHGPLRHLIPNVQRSKKSKAKEAIENQDLNPNLQHHQAVLNGQHLAPETTATIL